MVSGNARGVEIVVAGSRDARPGGEVREVLRDVVPTPAPVRSHGPGPRGQPLLVRVQANVLHIGVVVFAAHGCEMRVRSCHHGRWWVQTHD